MLHAAASLWWLSILSPLNFGVARYHWLFDEVHPHRRSIGKCSKFECPAFQRPVRRPVASFTPFVPHSCRRGPGDEGGEAKFPEALEPCCAAKHLCTQACGIDFQECFDNFWECAERACAGFGGEGGAQEDCLHTAVANDPRFLPSPTTTEQQLQTRRALESEEVCHAFHELQRRACECVPEREVDVIQKDRLEDFLRHHAAERLDDRGRLKDRGGQLWKAWRGKRPEMFLLLMMEYRDRKKSKRKASYPRRARRSRKAAEL